MQLGLACGLPFGFAFGFGLRRGCTRDCSALGVEAFGLGPGRCQLFGGTSLVRQSLRGFGFGALPGGDALGFEPFSRQPLCFGPGGLLALGGRPVRRCLLGRQPFDLGLRGCLGFGQALLGGLPFSQRLAFDFGQPLLFGHAFGLGAALELGQPVPFGLVPQGALARFGRHAFGFEPGRLFSGQAFGFGPFSGLAVRRGPGCSLRGRFTLGGLAGGQFAARALLRVAQRGIGSGGRIGFGRRCDGRRLRQVQAWVGAIGQAAGLPVLRRLLPAWPTRPAQAPPQRQRGQRQQPPAQVIHGAPRQTLRCGWTGAALGAHGGARRRAVGLESSLAASV